MAVVVLVGSSGSPQAGDPQPSPGLTAAAEEDSFIIEAAEEGIRTGAAASAEFVSSHSAAAQPSFSGGTLACEGAQQISDSLTDDSEFSFCPGPREAPEALTIGLIRRAFAELKLPAGTLVIEPPDGLTLVNFDTNFYTTSTNPISHTVTLLGRAVTLQATPDTYTWNFDDGQSLTTSQPGAPYPRLDITHNYLRKGSYRPSLSTTYTGRYRVGTGPWRQIPGTVTIDGTGQPLRAIEAQPKLVGY
ncbi:MAG TPA: hypothetical protein VNT31_12855 [Nocardioides sp.]|nr:hypothetical protein [Nocardioides sp.]